MATPLTPELLAELESRWRRGRALVLDAMDPGLTDQQIDELLPNGFVLPEEARVWWRWRDGVTTPGLAGQIGSHRYKIPLSEALTARQKALDMDLDEWTGVVRLVYGTPELFIHVDRSLELAPVSVWEFAGGDLPTMPTLPSLGGLVLLWIDMIDSGVWATGPDGLPVNDWAKTPEWILKTGIEDGLED